MYVRTSIYALRFFLIHSHICHTGVLCYFAGPCYSEFSCSREGLWIKLNSFPLALDNKGGYIVRRVNVSCVNLHCLYISCLRRHASHALHPEVLYV